VKRLAYKMDEQNIGIVISHLESLKKLKVLKQQLSFVDNLLDEQKQTLTLSSNLNPNNLQKTSKPEDI
jgi:hypothetical protein